MFGFKKLHRKWLTRRPVPEAWMDIIHKNVPYYRRLPREKQNRLRKLIQIFIDEKRFEGCGGLELTDEMKVTIATQACILILGSVNDIYPDLRAVLVYPHHYFANTKQTSQDGVITEGIQARSGESWSYGNIVLAWDEVKHGASDIRDGHNLVFHEFAHQLDKEYGATSNINSPPENSTYLAWARVIGKEYKEFVNDLKRHHQTLINAYGAKNLAEFFAVATESFFEQPNELKQKHPDLYEQLKQFYQQDPATYLEN